MAISDFDLDANLEELDSKVKDELASNPEVEDEDGAFDISKLPITARRWIRLKDVVAVVADLKGSTNLSTGKYAASTASIYEASTGGIVKIFDELESDFLQIQGDGAFALFWGAKRYQRALCAAITVRTFSERHLIHRLEKRWPEGPETGFKVGVAAGRVLVKRVGIARNLHKQEPVWSGKAVNYAAKAAQGVDRHQIAITGSVWDRIENNDYLTLSCPCGGSSGPLWETTEIERLPDDDPDRQGRLLTSAWCKVHGTEFCSAILDGKTTRPELDAKRQSMQRSLMKNALFAKARREREERRRRRGLNG
jgi:class 3 adenylate cyclase